MIMVSGTPATRKVSCCAGDRCLTCVAGSCPTCLFGSDSPKVDPTTKTLLASGDKQILINPGQAIDNDFVDLAAYQVKPTDVVPIDVSEGLLKLTNAQGNYLFSN